MPRRRRQPVTLAVEPEELTRRYREGASLEDIGILCQCSGARIRAILVALGVEIRPRGGQSGGNGPNKFLRR